VLPPEPVFGGFTATPSLPEDDAGVFALAGGAVVGGTGVVVWGSAVDVKVGVEVRTIVTAVLAGC
jgi:hypothetical protein